MNKALGIPAARCSAPSGCPTASLPFSAGDPAFSQCTYDNLVLRESVFNASMRCAAAVISGAKCGVTRWTFDIFQLMDAFAMKRVSRRLRNSTLPQQLP